MQAKFKNKYENYKETKGFTTTYKDEGDRANQERIYETDIKMLIKKYGNANVEEMLKVKDGLYINNLEDGMPISERIKQRERIDKYFEMMPAHIRKEFDDNREVFYQSIITGEHEKLINNAIFTNEQSQNIITKINEKQNQIEQYKTQIKKMEGKLNELEKQMQTSDSISNVQPSNNQKA